MIKIEFAHFVLWHGIEMFTLAFGSIWYLAADVRDILSMYAQL